MAFPVSDRTLCVGVGFISNCPYSVLMLVIIFDL